MRTALRLKGVPQAKTAISKTYAAPIGGWNARDALASMAPIDAVSLVNWFPRASYLEFRGGHASHATGMTGIGKTLLVHNKLTGSNQLFCVTASGIYNVSSAGAVGASVLARTNGKHQTTMFGDGTNLWSIAVNGVDDPAYYDGTTWTAVDELTSPALTGYTGNLVHQFIAVNVFKGRLFFIPINSLSFWYLTAGAAGGALTQFSLAAEFKQGGYLMAMATWTRDGGSGVDDFAVFITSEGEAAVYQGTNPSSATTWGKVGTYRIGKPLGRRCVLQYGGDVLVVTENGTYPLSSLLQSGEEERSHFAISYKIQEAMRSAAGSYGATFGWRGIVLPNQDALLINVPLAEDGVHEQYVMNTITKSWCRFTKWYAEDFAVFNNDLYFCKSTIVYKAWTGTADDGNNIDFYAKQAFQDFGDPRQKTVTIFKPILSVNGPVTYGSAIDVDFEDRAIGSTSVSGSGAGGIWNVAQWNNAQWASGLSVVKQWSAPATWPGRWIAGKIQITSNALICRWNASIVMFQPGDGI